MIRELINFSDTLSEDFKSLEKRPKDGLHILLQIKKDGTINTSSETIEYGYLNKKTEEVSPFLKKCLQLQENAWMIDTNKCLDNITRAIHTCSPYSIAIKIDNLEGGKNYEKRKTDGKSIVYNSFDNYFEKANELIPDEMSEVSQIAANSFAELFKKESWIIIYDDIIKQRTARYNQFQSKINDLKEKRTLTKDKLSKTEINDQLKILELEALDFQPIADAEYVIFYVDISIENYRLAQYKYMAKYLLGQDKSEIVEKDKINYGVNKIFLNTANADKVFQLHQTALFDFSYRISSNELQRLIELDLVFQNNVLPNPLPLFIYKSELNRKAIGLYSEGKRTFRDIVNTLYQSHKDDFQNYYLLNWRRFKSLEILDFDFVPKFEYEINNRSGISITNLFELYDKETKSKKYYTDVSNIFELEDRVLKKLIQNKYHRVDYFSDIKSDDYERMPLTFLSYNKYRKAIYDFVYKSNRNAISGKEFDEMVFNSIKDDLNRANEYGIKEKLNYWYSLYNFFHKNNIDMASKLIEYQKFVSDIIEEKADLEIASDAHFAFAAGQVIYYLLSKSKSEDTSFRLMEPYLQKVNCKALQENIADDFARYKHENFSKSFEKVASFVLSYETDINMKKLQPQLLSGLFSKNQLFSNTIKNINQ